MFIMLEPKYSISYVFICHRLNAPLHFVLSRSSVGIVETCPNSTYCVNCKENDPFTSGEWPTQLEEKMFQLLKIQQKCPYGGAINQVELLTPTVFFRSFAIVTEVPVKKFDVSTQIVLVY